MGAIGKGLEKIGAQSCLNHLKIATNHIVFADIVDRIQGFNYLINQTGRAVTAAITRITGIKITFKQCHQIAGDIQIARQCICNKVLAVGNAQLFKVASVEAQHSHRAPVETRAYNQSVKAVILCIALPYGTERLFKTALHRRDIHIHVQGER